MAAVPGKNWGVATLCRNRGVGDFCFVVAPWVDLLRPWPAPLERVFRREVFAFLIRSSILPIK